MIRKDESKKLKGRELEDRLEGISNIVKGIVKHGSSFSIIESTIELYGEEKHFLKYWDYWMEEKKQGRL